MISIWHLQIQKVNLKFSKCQTVKEFNLELLNYWNKYYCRRRSGGSSNRACQKTILVTLIILNTILIFSIFACYLWMKYHFKIHKMLITRRLDEEENLKETIRRTQLVVESSNFGMYYCTTWILISNCIFDFSIDC